MEQRKLLKDKWSIHPQGVVTFAIVSLLGAVEYNTHVVEDSIKTVAEFVVDTTESVVDRLSEPEATLDSALDKLQD